MLRRLSASSKAERALQWASSPGVRWSGLSGRAGDGPPYIRVHGTVIQYQRKTDARYRLAPDWRDARRRRKLAGPIIRALRGSL